MTGDMSRCEVVFVGAGAIGICRRPGSWRSVVALERFDRGHARGSSHGGSRIFRFAYADPLYVGLARRALDGWRELEADAGCDLLDITSGIDHGDPDALDALVGALGRAGVDHELLAPEAAAARWPGMRFEGPVLHQPGADRCRNDAAVAVLQGRAVDLGGDIRFVLRADVAVVTAGAWVKGLLGELVDLPPMEVTEEPVFHFRPAAGSADSASWPSFVHHFEGFRYGLGIPGEGVKVADHHTGPVVEGHPPEIERFTLATHARGGPPVHRHR